MTDIDFGRSGVELLEHQRIGVSHLTERIEPEIGRVIPGCFALLDEMGAGKTLQVIYSAQILFERGEIDCVVVIAPASVRGVWADRQIGELAKYLWRDLPSVVTEYHARTVTWTTEAVNERAMLWVITNYEFLLSDRRLARILSLISSRRAMLVLDESSMIKSRNARRTRICLEIRSKCDRVVILNGTPISHSPGDMYAQGLVMHPMILGCKNYWHFRARYGIRGGFMNKAIVGWKNIDDLQRRFAPYVLRRLKEDCLDLPPKLTPVPVGVELTPATWKTYCEMRDELIAWLSEDTVAIARQAGVKVMRLAQITSGFVGGVESTDGDVHEPRVIGDEKLLAVVNWLRERVAEEETDRPAKILLWCRFRPEAERLHEALVAELGDCVGLMIGGQNRGDRERAVRALHPDTSGSRRAVLVGTTASGSMGINLAAAHTVMYVSNDTRLAVRLQSMDRVHRPGQKYPVSYFDAVASGPRGQRTIDHAVFRALREKENVASWTCSAWIRALRDDENERRRHHDH